MANHAGAVGSTAYVTGLGRISVGFAAGRDHPMADRDCAITGGSAKKTDQENSYRSGGHVRARGLPGYWPKS